MRLVSGVATSEKWKTIFNLSHLIVLSHPRQILCIVYVTERKDVMQVTAKASKKLELEEAF